MSKVALCCLKVKWIDDYYHENHYIENLGIAFLASFLRENHHEVLLLDGDVLKLNDAQVTRRILEFRPDCLCFSEISSNIMRALMISKLVKTETNCLVIFGDYFSSLSPVSVFKMSIKIAPTMLNGIVAGDGELPLLMISNSIDQKLPITEINVYLIHLDANNNIIYPSKSFHTTFDTLPFPARDSLFKRKINEKSVINIIGSRGCDFDCSFCTRKKFGELSERRWEGRSPNKIVEEMDQLHFKYKIKDFFFFDDNFLGPNTIENNRRIEVFSNLLSEKNYSFRISCRPDAFQKNREYLLQLLKNSGLYGIFIGVESGNNQQLRRYNKKINSLNIIKSFELLKKFRIAINIGFIMIDPNLTEEEFWENINFLASIDQLHYFRNICSKLIFEPTFTYNGKNSLPKFIGKKYNILIAHHNILRELDYLFEKTEINFAKSEKLNQSDSQNFNSIKKYVSELYIEILKRIISSVSLNRAEFESYIVKETAPIFNKLSELSLKY